MRLSITHLTSIVAGALAAASLCAAPAASASAFTLSGPLQIGTSSAPGGGSDYISNVQCVDATHCLAVDSSNHLFQSSDPSGGASSWQLEPMRGASGIKYPSLQCVTATVCLLTGKLGKDGVIMRSTDGGADWSRVLDDGRQVPLEPECPSAELCWAIDQSGLLTSAGPHAGESWAHATAPVGRSERACVAPDDCAVLPSDGHKVLLYENAGRPGATHWSRSFPDMLYSLSCPTVNLCMVGGFSGRVWITHDPWSRDAQWVATPLLPDVGVAPDTECFTAVFCEANPGLGNQVRLTTDAGAGQPTWNRGTIGPSDVGINAIACPSTDVCLAQVGLTTGHGGQELFATTDATASKPVWTRIAVAPESFSCASPSLCLVTDLRGALRVLTR